MSNSSYYARPDQLVVEGDGRLDALACQRMRLDFPEQQGRGEVCMGRTQNGDIYAATVAAFGAGGSIRKLAQRLFRSADSGVTWTSELISLPSGSVLTAFTVLNDDIFLATDGGNLIGDRTRICINKSSDKGRHWEQISTIPADPYENIGEGFLSLTQLSDGTIIFPVARWNSAKEGQGLPDFPHCVYRSADAGVTWQGGDPNGKMLRLRNNGSDTIYSGLGGTFPGCLETHIIELKTGRLLAAFRYSGRQLDWHKAMIQRWGGKTEGADGVGRIFQHVFLGDSEDKGKTWKNLRPLFDADGKPLLVFGQCHGQLVELPDGRVVLVHDKRRPYESLETLGRVSEDGGKTWSRDVYHLLAGNGYAASVALEDGTIVTVAGATRSNAKGQPIEPWNTQVIRWNPRPS